MGYVAAINERLLKIELDLINIKGWIPYVFFIGILVGMLISEVLKG